MIKALGIVLIGLFILSVDAQALGAGDSVVYRYVWDFSKADSIARRHNGYPLGNLKALSDSLTHSLREDRDKFRSIYRWVCNNIANDYALYTKNKRKREKLNDDPQELEAWNREFFPKVMSTLISHQRTVCTGYAYLIRELAYHAGINCVMINGYGRSAVANIGGPGYINHSWNAVELGGTWYLCDATWSSGSIDPAKARFIREFDEAYFLTYPGLFAQNHYPEDSSWILMTDPPSLEVFLEAPLIYRGGMGCGIQAQKPETFHVVVFKGDSLNVQFQMQDKVSVENIHLKITSSGESQIVNPQVEMLGNDIFVIKHRMAQSGQYILHLLIDDEYAMTYEVEVKKKR